MATATSVIYEVEVNNIKSEYHGGVTIEATEADYQKRRDEEEAGIDYKDDTPEARLRRMRFHRGEPRRFGMTLTKDEARGFGIGARVRVTVELV